MSTVTAPVAEVTAPVSEVAKSVIALDQVKVPDGVQIKSTKTSVVFSKNARKAILKGRRLEVTSVVKGLGVKFNTFSPESILNDHLGKVKMAGRVETAEELQTKLRIYFK